MTNLNEISTESLAEELKARKDLLTADGLMPPPLYQLIAEIQVIPCVDGVAVRRNGERIEGMMIRRGTREFAGCLCSVLDPFHCTPSLLAE